jgi:transcriptional regulator, XRE family
MVRDRLKEKREEKNISLSQLSKLTGIPKSNLQRYETGATKKIPMDVIANIEKALCLNTGYLMGWEDKTTNIEDRFPSPGITENFTTFPVIGDIAAGYDHIAIENWDGERIDVPNSYLKGHPYTDFFVLCVVGDSMFPTYQDGDKVLILKQSTMDYSGQIGAILYDDDECATLKKIEYRDGENWVRLVPINPNCPPITIENEELEQCRVLGVPRLLIREIL